MFKNFNWENILLGLLAITCAVVIVFIAGLCFGQKYTRQYSLGKGGPQDKGNTLTITKEIDWCQDDEIVLDRSITYFDAVRLVDSLNKTLIRP